MKYIKTTYQRGKEYGFSNRYIFVQMIRGAFRGYNTLTEV